jgi:UDP-2,4-diacetamido-2,4,6-trideoxy-beta-L-altropyranose hydrolase
MKVLFRTDGNKKLGLGHITRSLSLANELKKRKIQSVFLLKDNQSNELIKKHGFSIVNLKKNENENKIINNMITFENFKAVIFDSKRKSLEKLVKELRKKTKIVLIDNNSIEADLIILPGVKEQFKKITNNCLVGLEYTLLNPKINNNNKIRKTRKILLSCGGTDQKDITKKVVLAFLKSELKFSMTVCLGKFYKNKEMLKQIIKNDKRFTIIIDSNNFPKLMKESTLGIFTFGVSVFEAAVCKLPSLIISHSYENDESAKIIEKYGWSKYLGKYDQINYNDFPTNALKILENNKILEKMIKKCSQIDGNGANRISEKIIQLVEQRNVKKNI